MQRTSQAGRGLLVLALVVGIITGAAGATPAGAASTPYLSAPADGTYQALPFSQNWTNTGLISVDDNWSGVPGIIGYRGDDLTTTTGTDPQTILADGSGTPVDVNANRSDPNTFSTGGVGEFDGIANPVVALTGSGTADAPFLLLHINTSGFQSIAVSYNLRDIDGSTDNSVQQVALHYRVGSSGAFTNLPAGYVADASSGPGLATLVTPVNVTLPSAADNQAQVQLRIMTTNAAGNDEWIGVDDISITGTPIAGDTAPSVLSTNPTAGASGVPANTPISVTFSEPVVFSGPISIVCNPGGTQSGITPTGGPTTWSLPHADFGPGDSCSITIPAGQVSDVDTNDPPDTLLADYSWSFTVASGCGAAATPIHAIQGSGTASPVAGATVTVEGLVVGDFQASTQLRGFFVQEEPADFDADPATSEGIFVFEGSSSLLNVAVGDKVRLTGTVSEYADRTVGGSTLTELSSVSALQACTSGNAVASVSVTLPETANGDLERYEGMLVSIASPMTISQNYFLGRYGQMTLSANGRMFQSTNVYDPGSPAQVALADENARRILILDDGRAGVRCGDNPNPVPYLGGPPPAVIRAGDDVSNLVGVLDYGQINSGSTGSCSDSATLFAGDFRLHPTQTPVFTNSNVRPATPPATGGSLRVASANLLNYFNTFGAGACTLGVGGGATDCRGADTQAEFDRQAAKLVLAITNNGADVIGFMEMENDGYGANSAIQNLVDRLNTATAPGTYAFVNPDTAFGVNALGVDAIKVGVIYKPAKVTPAYTAVLNSPAFTDPANSGTQKSRPALAQTFEDTTWGERFTVVVNHLKSKGSNCSPSSIPNDDDPVQGNCNGTRTAGAAAEVAWLSSTLIPSSADTDVVVMGDMNAYAKEDPIDQFVNAGYTNTIEQFHGTTGYSYIFDGMSGNLDHALASAGLAARVTGANEWHINADEPTVIDYDQNFNPAGYYTADHYRSSDHDPLVVGLNLLPDLTDLASSYGLAWHTDGGKLRLGQLWTGEATNTPGGDTGDDGISIDTSAWQRGGTTSVTAVVTGGNGWLAGWADWDNNGVFTTPGERIVNQAVTAGTNTINGIPIPANAAVGVPIAMRFRLYAGTTEPAEQSPQAAQPTGRGTGGEAEDQSVQAIPLATTVTGFGATAQASGIQLAWETTSELNTQGFNVYRSPSPAAPQTLLAFVPSQAPGSTGGASYTWLDPNVAPGQTYYYWLEHVDLSGATTLYGPVEATAQAPTAVTLSGLGAASQSGGASAGRPPVLLLLALAAGAVGGLWLWARLRKTGSAASL